MIFCTTFIAGRAPRRTFLLLFLLFLCTELAVNQFQGLITFRITLWLWVAIIFRCFLIHGIELVWLVRSIVCNCCLVHSFALQISTQLWRVSLLSWRSFFRIPLSRLTPVQIFTPHNLNNTEVNLHFNIGILPRSAVCGLCFTCTLTGAHNMVLSND